MKKILITGATGNIGFEVIRSLSNSFSQFDVVAGVRNLQKDSRKLIDYKISFIRFDFTEIGTYKSALENVNVLFLLRPPQIVEVARYFKPLIRVAKESGIEHIVFLSVQGVENNRIIPHNKIEKLIVESGIPYTFLRPAYFMQNFSTTLLNDLVFKKTIFLPAGNSRFTLIDIRDIGAVASKILTEPTMHFNKSYELTCNEKLTFKEMAQILSDCTEVTIRYQSPDLLNFILTKRKEKMPLMFILVMIMLHYFPQFKQEPKITDWVYKITGRQPFTFQQFVEDNDVLNQLNKMNSNFIKNQSDSVERL